MSREGSYQEFRVVTAAAAAATDTQYHIVSDHANTGTGPSGKASAFLAEGFSWMYASTEANADNTIDFVVDYTQDGSNYTTIHTNANTVGLADTGTILTPFTMIGDAAIAAAAGVAITRLSGSTSAALPNVRVPGESVIRFRMTTAGTGTVPAIHFTLYGHWV